MKGYVHDIKLDDGNDGETIKVIAKCYRSYKKSETPNKLLMDIDIENKVITDVMCCYYAKSNASLCKLRGIVKKVIHLYPTLYSK